MNARAFLLRSRRAPDEAPGAEVVLVETPVRRRDFSMLLVAASAVPAVAVWNWLAHSRSLWFDETLTLLQTRGSVADVIMAQADGFHPPMFHLGIYVWTSILGTTPLDLRAYSMVMGVLFAAAVYILTRHLYDRRVAAVATLLVLYAPFVAWYASDARMYMQTLTLGTFASYCLLRGEETGKTRWLFAYWLVGSVMMLTHYFNVEILAAHGVYFFFRRWYVSSFWRAIARSFAQFILPTMALAGWLYFVATWGHQTFENTPVYPPPSIYSVFDAIVSVIFGYHSRGVNLRLVAAWPVVFIALSVSLGLLGRLGARGAFLLALAITPVVMLVVGSHFGPRNVFDPRYLAIVSVPVFIWLALLANRVSSRLALAGLTVAVAAGFAGASWASATVGDNPRIYDFQRAAKVVADERAFGDAVVVAPGFVTPGIAMAYSFQGPVSDWVDLPNRATATWRVSRSPFDSQSLVRHYFDAWGLSNVDSTLAVPVRTEPTAYVQQDLPPTTGRIWLVTTFEEDQVETLTTVSEPRRLIAANADLVSVTRLHQVTVSLYQVHPAAVPAVEDDAAVAGPSVTAADPEDDPNALEPAAPPPVSRALPSVAGIPPPPFPAMWSISNPNGPLDGFDFIWLRARRLIVRVDR